MTISLVIPHWNRRELLEAALAALAELEAPPGTTVETIVVDNASTDGSQECALNAGARVIRLDRNQGVSKALNIGIRAAQGQYVALLNNDVELDPKWLVRLHQALEELDAWFATGKTLRLSDRTRIDGAGDAVCRGGTAWRLGSGRQDGPQFNSPRSTYFPSATAALFRRDFFERVGFFEESFFAYLEDVDLGLRAGIDDLAGIYVPQAVAYHAGSETTGQWSEAMVRWMTAHQLLLLAKFYSGGLLLRFARPIFAAQLLWAGMAVSRGRSRAWWQGMRDGLSRARGLRAEAAELRSRGERLPAVLRRAEAEIMTFQRSTGFDGYWKWYGRLVWPPVEKQA